MADNDFPEWVYVVLHLALDLDVNPQTVEMYLPISTRVKLTDDIWVEKLDTALARRIIQACEPANYNVSIPQLDKHLYAFIRPVPSNEVRQYEGIQKLFGAIALSRLIQPNSTGLRYRALVGRPNSDGPVIKAIQFIGVSPDIFLSENTRNWLSEKDCDELRQMTYWLDKETSMHRRVHMAYWSHEEALRSARLDLRWVSVISGLEALMNVGRNRNSQQFRKRVHQLAEEFKVDVSDDELKRAYNVRSKLAHRQGFLFELKTILPEAQRDEVYRKLESLLRMTIKRCLLDKEFGDRFRDDSAVEDHWPLVTPSNVE